MNRKHYALIASLTILGILAIKPLLTLAVLIHGGM